MRGRHEHGRHRPRARRHATTRRSWWRCSAADPDQRHRKWGNSGGDVRPVPRQETDDGGQVKFDTIFPACYSGRWPHIHFEAYPSLAKATNSANKIATSQIALPQVTAKAVYATSGYEQSVRNLGQVSLDSDNVFSDGYDLQMPRVTGDEINGYQLPFSCAV